MIDFKRLLSFQLCKTIFLLFKIYPKATLISLLILLFSGFEVKEPTLLKFLN